MFPWNIAKSAEAMFSRWATKRLCKFLLKKKLGQFILGDIDLDQLDVQLTRGTIQLSDLALNVDYINKKLSKAASLIVKEGSIGYLLIQLPWSGKGCQVELNGLELVVSPSTDNIPMGDEACVVGNNDNGRLQHGSTSNDQESSLMDVHEGVKTIAKMVKVLLTSFNVKIENAIVAYDPSLDEGDKKTDCHRTLVLRISEIECGTCLSEDADSNADVLGISWLTNFVRFQGATFELLKIDEDDTCASSSCELGAGCGEPVLGSTKAACPVMTGKKEGFGGEVKISIPWKSGCLDIRRVDAVVSVDPLVLTLQLSTIKWLLRAWESYNNLEKNGQVCTNHNSKGYAQLKSTTLCSSSNSVSVSSADYHSFLDDSSNLTSLEPHTESLVPESRLISNWVPLSADINNKDGIQELDFVASVDQFFECLDGMRSSQSALGSSGMWNWTCSVFSAISAASTLASGSLHAAPEKQHEETNLRATFAGISVVLSFGDEDQQHCYGPNTDDVVGLHIDYLVADCNEILLSLQVCPQVTVVEGMMKNMEVATVLNSGIDTIDSGLHEYNNAKNQNALVQHLQAEVLGALPSSVSCDLGPDSDSLFGLVATDFPLGNNDSLFKVTLFETSGVTNCKFTSQSSSGGNLTGPVSFSLSLPPFTFWVIFSVISVFTNLLKNVEKSVEVLNKANKDIYKASDKKDSATERLSGDISISSARVILCFASERGGDQACFFSREQFIALDFTSPSPLKKSFTEDYIPMSNASSKRRFPSADAKSLQLSFSDLCIYLITSTNNDYGRISSCTLQNEKFSASCLLSVDSRSSRYSVINVVWQEGLVTGPWVTKKARLLANSDQFRSRDDFVGKGYEFAAASTVKDLEELKSQTQQEMILSSSFFIHVHLHQVMVSLSDSQYKDVHCLVHQMLNELECVASQSVTDEKESFPSQSSVSVECDSLGIVISRDTSESIRCSLQSELPGLWHQLKLKVQNFDLLSVTNTGGVGGAEFFRVTHGEGKLWGTISSAPDHEFLLITCDDSSMKRGDGGGSNPLSSRHAGSDIIHLSDPEISHVSTSITVTCSTVVAVGGRLDWLNAISSFFSFPSSDTQESGSNTVLDEDAKGYCRTDFVLNLIDIALSYEPYVMNSVVQSEVKESESGFYSNQDTGKQYASCLLAASLLTLSTTALVDSVENSYLITVQDLGLHVASGTNTPCSTYSFEHLQKVGFIKVAREAFMEANFKTNCTSGTFWVVELSNSHIYVDTCHDTTASLIRLGTQLQQLFAPDVEESIVHLQNRWENVQQAKLRNDFNYETNNPTFDALATTSQQCPSKSFLEDGSTMAGLMDEICDDAFQVHDYNTWRPPSSGAGIHMPPDGIFIDDMNKRRMEEPEVLSHKGSLSESMPVMGAEGNDALFLEEGLCPEIIEEYCLSDLLISMGVHSEGVHRYKQSNVAGREIERGSGGWYQGNSLKVVENHISGKDEQTELKHSAVGKLPPNDDSLQNKAYGRVILKKIDLRWRIYGGSDWPMENEQHSGRDTTVCLEFALSGMKFQYDIFPVGGITISKMSVSVQDFNLYDGSRDAPWKLVLGYYHSKGHPRESSSKALRLDLEAVRPDPLTPLEEYRLHLAFLPIKLHLHQSQLDFLIEFFGSKSSSSDQSPDHPQNVEGSIFLPERRKNLEALLPYFQNIDIRPILFRVDYSPHHVDLAALRRGKYVELVNLVPWKGVELNLKHVHAAGIYGWGSVCETIIGEWLEDISHNQIHKILRRLPAVRSLFAIGDGAAKLVSSPLENYRKDRRVLKGMQRGTIAFLRSISLEAVGLGVHLAAGAHDILLQAEYILGSVPASITSPLTDKLHVRSNQPQDAHHGIKQAYESLSDGLGKSAAVLVQRPLKKYQRGSGAGPALAAAFRAVPAAAIAPASACASAVHCALLGIRNSLDPERKKESMEKYCPTQPWEED